MSQTDKNKSIYQTDRNKSIYKTDRNKSIYQTDRNKSISQVKVIKKKEENPEDIFTELKFTGERNTPIFFVDVSGSTESVMYTKKIKKDNRIITRNVKIMDYEFILISSIAKKMGYTNCHIICWSSSAKLFKNIDPTNVGRLKTIQQEIKSIVNGTYMMSGFNLLTDDMFDENKLTELIILTDGEIGDSKKQIDLQIRNFATKNTDVRIVAVERGDKNYIKDNCQVGNLLFRYIRESNMTRLVSSFSIYNSLKQEFINFSNPRVPEGYVPYMNDKMFKKTYFRQFMVHVDSELINISKNFTDTNSKMDVMRYTHAITLSIYHCIRDMSHSEQMAAIEIFSNMYQRFPENTGIYQEARQLLISEVDNHITGRSTTFTEAKKTKHLKIENANMDLMNNVKLTIMGQNTDSSFNTSYLIRTTNNKSSLLLKVDSRAQLEDVSLDKVTYRKSCTSIDNLRVPIIFKMGNNEENKQSAIQWTRILYSRILNISPSNPDIWYYVAVDGMLLNLASKQAEKTANEIPNEFASAFSNYTSIVDAFLNEEIFGTGKRVIDRIILENKVKIDYRILKAAANYFGLNISPLSLFAMIVKTYIVKHFKNSLNDFSQSIVKFCAKQLFTDLGIDYDDDDEDNANLTILTNQLVDKIISDNTQLVEQINYNSNNICTIQAHNIPDINIMCPERYLDELQNNNDIEDFICTLCTARPKVIITPKTSPKNIEGIYKKLTNLSLEKRSHIIDMNLGTDLGMMDGANDNETLFCPDRFSDNSEYVKCDNVMIVDPISSSKMRVHTQEEFLKMVELKYPYIKDLDMTNVALAGGFVRSVLLKQEMKDFDFFFYGLDDEKAFVERFRKLIVDVINNVRKYHATFNRNVKFGMFFKPMFNVFELICFDDPTNHITENFTLENFHSYKYHSLRRYTGDIVSSNKEDTKHHIKDISKHKQDANRLCEISREESDENEDNIKNKHNTKKLYAIYDDENSDDETDDNSDESNDDSDETNDDSDETNDNNDESNDDSDDINRNGRNKNIKRDKNYFEDGDDHGIRMRHRFQFVLCKYKKMDDIIKTFDLYRRVYFLMDLKCTLHQNHSLHTDI